MGRQDLKGHREESPKKKPASSGLTLLGLIVGLVIVFIIFF